MIRRIFSLLSEKQRKRGIWVIFSMLVRSLLDFAGIAALVPVIFVIADKLGNERKLILLLCCGVILFVILKNCIILLLNRFQTKFQMGVYRDFSRRMFINHYDRGLMFLKKQSSMQLAFEVNGLCLTYSQGVLGSLFRIIGEAFLILIIVAALIVWKPLMGVLAALLFLPVAAIYGKVIKKRVRKIGQASIEAQRVQSRTVAEAFRGYAELEIADAFHTSLDAFDTNLNSIIRNRRSMEMFQLFPFFLSEMAVVAGLMILALFGGDDLVVAGGVFAIAAFRIIPSVKSLMNNYTTLQNNANVIEVMEKGLTPGGEYAIQDAEPSSEIAENPTEDFRDEYPLLEARELGFAFPDGEILFDNLDFKINKGDRIGIRGRSGAGKSTLFNLLLGFFSPTKGEIRINGRKLGSRLRRQWQDIVGYVPQEIFIIKGSLAENVALGQAEIDREKVMKVLEQVSLKEWTEALPEGLDTELGEFGSRLSGGQKQRIGIARALYKGAEVLFFDEATSSLDSATEKEINLALEDLSKKYRELTMIIIAHRETSLGVCTKFIDL